MTLIYLRDELNNAMQLLGLTAMDLLNPANLSALYCEGHRKCI